MAMQAGSLGDPLLADFQPDRIDPIRDWSLVSWIAGSRAQQLVDDFPVAAAIVRAVLLGTHGANGLRFRSLYQRDDEADTDDQEERMRIEIDARIASTYQQVDAAGTMSRAEFEWMLDWISLIYGDAFAVRVMEPGVPADDEYVTRWRIVHPWRVRSPRLDALALNRAEWIDGGKFSPTGKLEGIGVAKDTDGGYFLPIGMGDVEFVPLRAPDGTPNVIHRRQPITRIGHWRGLTAFAPIILESRLLQGLGVAYVATKRTQASHPLMIKTEDVAEAREQYKGTRMANLVMGLEDDVVFSSWKFEGADYQAFYDVQLRNLCSPLGVPYELAMGDHSAKSGASARSTWQAYYMHSAQRQVSFIDQVSRKLDESYIREAMIRKWLPTESVYRLMLGKYLRPQRITPDPLKEAQSAELLAVLGVSKTTLFEQMGLDYTDEQKQVHQDRVISEAQNPTQSDELPEVDEPEDGEDSTQEPDAMETQEMEPVSLSSSDFLAGMSSFASSIRSTIGEIPSVLAAKHAEPQQVVIHNHIPPNHINVKSPDNYVTVEAQKAPIVNVSSPVVNVPQQAAPVVNVLAAEQLAPIVNVSVDPTPVTIENNVEVPQRTVRAKPQPNGDVLMVPEGH